MTEANLKDICCQVVPTNRDDSTFDTIRFWECRNHSLPVGQRTLIMGVVNVTPDSFSDGGRFFDTEKAVEQVIRLAEDGADIIDIGGQSTRPGSEPVSESEELDRILPVIEKVISHLTIPISVDTTRVKVAKKVLKKKVHIINDISGLHYEPELAKVVKEFQAGMVLMHIREQPKTMQNNTEYSDLFGEISNYLKEGISTATKAGISRNQLVIDPGIGFGKSLMDNYRLIDRLELFRPLGCPIMIGPSRKSFIGNVLDLPANQRIWGTAAAVACAVLRGADIVRVHDVKEMVQVVKICDMFKEVRKCESIKV
jgi:dihydropteroate synthase